MARKRWICISRAIQWQRSNEFAPQRDAVMMPCFLNMEENNRIFWPDLFGVVIFCPFSLHQHLIPCPVLIWGKNRTLRYISPFCVVFPNLTCPSSHLQGWWCVHYREGTWLWHHVFLWRDDTRGCLAPMLPPPPFLQWSWLAFTLHHRCPYPVYMLADKGRFKCFIH